MANLLQTDSFSTAMIYKGGLKNYMMEAGTAGGVLNAFLEALILSPSVIILSLVMIGSVFVFSDRTTHTYKWATVAGIVNALVHFAVFPFVFWLSTLINDAQFDVLAGSSKINPNSVTELLIFSFQVCVIGGFLGSLTMGIYPLICILVVSNHYTEAFSSFHCADYKNFIRFHVTADTLTIYPIGIDKVTRKWDITEVHSKDPDIDKPIVCIKGALPQYHLIENPISILLP